ncbi:hypothetical protein EI94DRAFT_295677 [Lactarius quietus]|nr:hypothetical protein EI94DRAFT_295677 [Lactarius quietus]
MWPYTYCILLCSCSFTFWGATSRALEKCADFGGFLDRRESTPRHFPWTAKASGTLRQMRMHDYRCMLLNLGGPGWRPREKPTVNRGSGRKQFSLM